MYKYYNAHPKGLNVKDCALRAYCTAMKMDYNDARNKLNRMKRDLGFTSYKCRSFIKILYKDYNKISFPAEKGYARMNGQLFMEKFPKGVYILNMAKHLSVCIDGDILDTWDCTDKCIYNAWEVK